MLRQKLNMYIHMNNQLIHETNEFEVRQEKGGGVQAGPQIWCRLNRGRRHHSKRFRIFSKMAPCPFGSTRSEDSFVQKRITKRLEFPLDVRFKAQRSKMTLFSAVKRVSKREQSKMTLISAACREGGFESGVVEALRYPSFQLNRQKSPKISKINFNANENTLCTHTIPCPQNLFGNFS